MNDPMNPEAGNLRLALSPDSDDYPANARSGDSGKQEILAEISEMRQQHKELLKDFENRYYFQRVEPSKGNPSGFQRHLSLNNLTYYTNKEPEPEYDNDSCYDEYEYEPIADLPPTPEKNALSKIHRVISHGSLSSQSSGISSASPSNDSGSGSRKNFGNPAKDLRNNPRTISRLARGEKPPKVTIPVPFSFSLRQNQQLQRRHSCMDLHSIKSDDPIFPKFKARPVPPSTYLPIYDHLEVKQMLRKTMQTSWRKEVQSEPEDGGGIMNIEMAPPPSKPTPPVPKPRKFAPPPILKRAIQYRQQNPGSNDSPASGDSPNTSKPRNGKYKRQRSTMSKELVSRTKSASANRGIPPSHSCGYEPVPSSTGIRKVRSVPDFYAQQQAFENSMDEARTRGLRTTVAKPFNLTQPRPKRVEPLQLDQKPMVRKSKSLNYLFDSGNDYEWNRAAKLRAAALRKRMAQEADGHPLRQQYIDKHQLKKELAATMERTLRSVQRRDDLRESDRERQLQYRREMEEMERRVANRPSLLERQARFVRRQKMEQRYKEALEKAGLDARRYISSQRDAFNGTSSMFRHDYRQTSASQTSLNVYGTKFSSQNDDDEDSLHLDASIRDDTMTSNRGTIILGEDPKSYKAAGPNFVEPSSSESSSVYEENHDNGQNGY